MFCGECGKRIPAGVKFCTECGAKVAAVTEPDRMATGSAYSYVPPKKLARDVIYEAAPQNGQPETGPARSAEKTVFCAHCGSKLQKGDRFCMHCGGSIDTPAGSPVAAQPVNEVVPGKQKKSKRRTVAIVLIVLQLIALYGSIVNGSLEEMLSDGAAGFFELLGSLLIGIIGVILLVIDRKKQKT